MIKFMRHLFFLLLFPLSGYGQNTIAFPDVINYSKQAYGAGLQNWDIKQDKNGIIYAANNEGLLSFDGRNWNLYPLPNRTIVRSIEIAPDHHIYVGGQDELGYFAPAANGELVYHNLIPKLELQDRNLGDVWDILAFKDRIFVRSSSRILEISPTGIHAYLPEQEWSFLASCNDELYAYDYNAGLKKLRNGAWFLVPGFSVPLNSPVTAMLSIGKDTILVTTLKTGMFLLSGEAAVKIQSPNNAILENARIYKATIIDDQWLALATSNKGVFIVDHKGNIIQSFSLEQGLQNNNVLCIFLDRQKNLWLGLDNGIDFIGYNSPIKQINPGREGGSGYTALIHQNQLYLGTSSALFTVPLQPVQDLSFSKGNFVPVANTRGQNWKLTEINNELLLGHHEGAFLVKGQLATLLSDIPGFWNFTALPPGFPHSLIAGYYRGLMFFDKTSSGFVPSEKIVGFDESSRFVSLDGNQNIWVSHPYHGVYSIARHGVRYTITKYGKKEGLPSELGNHLYQVKDQIMIGTEQGVYYFDAGKNRFLPEPELLKLLGTQSIRYLKNDPAGNLWFIHDKDLGVIDRSGSKPEVIMIPELHSKMLSGFEFLYPVNASNIFLGGEKGFYHINYEKLKKSPVALQVQVRQVRIVDHTDSLLFGGFFNHVDEPQQQQAKQIPRLANHWKTLHFEYSAAIYGYQANLSYSYRLKGFEDNWSEWTKRTEKEYTNLPAGKYIFQVRARNNLGGESEAAFFAFTILPPWYETIWAKLLYVILAIIGVVLLYQRMQTKFQLQSQRYEEEQKRLLYIHELERNKVESELVALGNEKLEAEINFKNSELASSAMHLVKKGELISKIKGEITQVMKVVESPQATSELKKVIRSLNEDDHLDEEWQNFTKHFDKVQSDFIVELKALHPTITKNELKLCAFLRMNLTTKEIAQLMNISVRGVEISRYRLRKKLGITSDTSLFDHLITIQTKA